MIPKHVSTNMDRIGATRTRILFDTTKYSNEVRTAVQCQTHVYQTSTIGNVDPHNWEWGEQVFLKSTFWDYFQFSEQKYNLREIKF